MGCLLKGPVGMPQNAALELCVNEAQRLLPVTEDKRSLFDRAQIGWYHGYVSLRPKQGGRLFFYGKKER